jgi:hypothetical protein
VNSRICSTRMARLLPRSQFRTGPHFPSWRWSLTSLSITTSTTNMATGPEKLRCAGLGRTKMISRCFVTRLLITDLLAAGYIWSRISQLADVREFAPLLASQK